MREVRLLIPDDLYHYLAFLEKSRFIKSKQDAVHTALEFYKMLAMHDWLPHTYRMGGGRVLLLDVSMLLDLFHFLSNREIHTAARASALKRKVTNPFFKDVDFSEPQNWSIALRELEIMGWGEFKLFKNEIRIESCPLPLPYLQGYLEGMFGVEFYRHPSKLRDVTVLISRNRKQRKG